MPGDVGEVVLINDCHDGQLWMTYSDVGFGALGHNSAQMSGQRDDGSSLDIEYGFFGAVVVESGRGMMPPSG